MADRKDLKKSLDEAAKPVKQPAQGPANVASSLSPSAHRRAAKQVSVTDNFDRDTAFHMAFLGTGQGGSRMANAFWRLGYRRIGLFNTTENDWITDQRGGPNAIAVETPKLSLDIGGAKKDMQLARRALQDRDEEVWDLMQRAWGNKFDCAVICAGLGGGTGSGTALPLARLARKYMEAKGKPPRVGAIVALPMTGAQQDCRNAVTAFNELVAEGLSPLIVIDNVRVHELYAPPTSQLLSKANELVSRLFHLFNELGAAKSEHATFDRSEFAQLMDSGLVAMGAADIAIADIQNPADISTAIREQLAQSVLAQVDLRRGKVAACVFVSSEEALETFSQDYFDAGFEQLNRIVGSAYAGTEIVPVVHRGLYRGSEPDIQCYTMVSGLEPPGERLKTLARAGGLDTNSSTIAKHLKLE